MKKWKLWLLIGSCVLLTVMPAYSQERGLNIEITDETGQAITLYQESYALIIGVSDYTAGWPDLPGVKKDVEAVRAALEQQGFQIMSVMDPTRIELEQAFQTFIAQHGQAVDNRLLFYFAGHGHTMKLAYGGEMGYIVPTDAPNPFQDETGFLTTALDMQQIEVYAKRIQSKHAMFLFDSCFSGSIFSLSRAVPENISYKTAQPVRQFMTSGSAEEQVPDESIFRAQLVAALQGEADLNGDGYITGSELGEFLQGNVVNYSKGAQHPQYGKIRDPNLDKGDFVFMLPGSVHVEGKDVHIEAGAAAQTGDPDFEMWELVKNSEEAADIQEYLSAFPEGRFAAAAQLKLKQLGRAQAESVRAANNASFHLAVDFEQGLQDFDEYYEEYGGELEVVNDPTGAQRGKVLQATITETLDEDEEYAVYPEVNVAFKQAPCRIQQDVWMSRQVYEDVRNNDGWLIFLTGYDRVDWEKEEFHRNFYVVMESDGRVYLSLVGDEDQEEEEYPGLLADAPQFQTETWHTLAVELDAAGLAVLYLDGRQITGGQLLAPGRNGLESVDAGPIGAAIRLRKKGTVLVDNFQFTCWSE